MFGASVSDIIGRTTRQATWRGHMARKRVQTYCEGRAARAGRAAAAVFSLWRRLAVRRPADAATAVRAADMLVKWRVLVCHKKIGAEKARDLRQLWEVLQVMRHLRAWRRCGRAQRAGRRVLLSQGTVAWMDWEHGQRAWKRLRLGCVRRSLYHAFRALYFWARCAAKCRRRSYKLFRCDAATPRRRARMRACAGGGGGDGIFGARRGLGCLPYQGAVLSIEWQGGRRGERDGARKVGRDGGRERGREGGGETGRDPEREGGEGEGAGEGEGGGALNTPQAPTHATAHPPPRHARTPRTARARASILTLASRTQGP